MTTQRRSYETGHQPKCLVIVDDTAEWDRVFATNVRGPMMLSREVGRQMLARGAEVDAMLVANPPQDPNSRISLGEATPFLVAASRGHTEVMRLLAAKGADANARTVDGSTALLMTALYRSGRQADALRAVDRTRPARGFLGRNRQKSGGVFQRRYILVRIAGGTSHGVYRL